MASFRALIVLAACTTLAFFAFPSQAASLDLVETDVGIAFVHAGSRADDTDYKQTMGSGACVLDHDGDGWEDLLLVNALHTDPATQAAIDPRSALYRNLDGNGFALVPGVLNVSAWGMGCAAADMDADGDMDVALHTWGGPQLFRNDGGSFTNVTSSLPIVACGQYPCFGSSIAFFDADADADLDLYATNYVDWDMLGGSAPVLYDGQCNVLFRNLGGGLWEDATSATGLADCGNDHLGLSIADFTGDGRQDVFIASDETPDALYVAQPNGTFVDRASEWGVADLRGGMGVAAGYFDDDARLDIVISHFETEGFALYRANASGGFDDAAHSSGMHNATTPFVGWGIEWVDLDHDGDQDLVGVNGHIPGFQFDPTQLDEGPILLDNDGAGHLTDVTLARWKPSGAKAVSRGLAMADFNQDGDMDLVVVDNANTSARYVEATVTTGNWLEVDPAGDAIGAMVEVDAGGRSQRREIVAASSYQSQSSRVAHFGLGNATRVDALRIVWPDGTASELGAAAANARLFVSREGALTTQRAGPLASLSPYVEIPRHATWSLAGEVLRAPEGSTYEMVVDGVAQPGRAALLSWSEVGDHEVRFRIQAPDGRQDEAIALVRVVNAAPVAALSHAGTADRVSPVLFDGAASSDPDGSIANWTWTIDGTTSWGRQAERSFATLGVKNVSLRVTDNEGAVSSADSTILVENVPPTARAGADRASNRVAFTPFSGSSSADPDGSSLSFHWAFGDGGSATGTNVSHRYAVLGDHEAVLTVTDADGASATDTLIVHVTDEDLPPEARVSAPATADRVTPARFDASASVDLDGEIVGFHWTFGDGAEATGALVEHLYAALGAHTVVVEILDDDGLLARHTSVVDVRNLAPRIDAIGSRLQEGPGPFALDGIARDEDGAIVSHRWSLDGVEVSTEPRFEHTFDAYGHHMLRLEVEDSEGAGAYSQGEVWIFARPTIHLAAPESVDRITDVDLDASGTFDADGTVAGFSWSFSEGAPAVGDRVVRRFSGLGPQAIRLDVVDDDGFVSTAQRSILVRNLPPTVGIAAAPAIANLEQNVTLRAIPHDADGPEPRVIWRVDGDPLGEGATLRTHFTVLGAHLVEAIAIDAEGDEAHANVTLVVTDALDANVTTTRAVYPIDKPIEGNVTVRFADGTPVEGARVDLAIRYRVPTPAGNESVTLREIETYSDAQGRYTFRLEDVWPEDSPRGLLPRIRPPTETCATYELILYTSWHSNAGNDSTRFQIVLTERTAPVCANLNGDGSTPGAETSETVSASQGQVYPL